MRVGVGQDSHRLTKSGKELVLGGVKFANGGWEQSHEKLFVDTNSDGDVVLHALCNALASAIGLGSISTYADKMCLEDNIEDSSKYVGYIFSKIQARDYKLQNASITIEAKKPKLEEFIPKMCKNIAKLLNTESDNIGITVTSGEGLTAFGCGEGIHVISIVCLKKK